MFLLPNTAPFLHTVLSTEVSLTKDSHCLKKRDRIKKILRYTEKDVEEKHFPEYEHRI